MRKSSSESFRNNVTRLPAMAADVTARQRSSSALLLLLLVPVLLSLAAWPLFTKMPPPFDMFVALQMPPDQLALLAGNKRGPALKPVLEGAYAANAKLKSTKRLFEGVVVGAESVAVMPSGELLMLDKFGYMHRAVATKGGEYILRNDVKLYIGPGRPLGYHVVNGGKTLLVCDSLKGLLEVSLKTGSIQMLVNTRPDGTPLHYANDLDVGSDGTVYFTASSDGTVALSSEGFYDTMRSYVLCTMRGERAGSLLSYDPHSRKTRELARGIAFANGVAVAADSSFVAVVETNAHRVLRHWLSGPHAGTTDVLIDRLPGVPDGLSRSSDGNFWVALVGKVSPIIPLIAPYRLLRQFASHIVPSLTPMLLRRSRWGAVIKISSNGEVLDALYDLDGEIVSSISNVVEHEGKLFFGNLAGNYVGVYKHA